MRFSAWDSGQEKREGKTLKRGDFPFLWSRVWNGWQEKLPVASPLLPSKPPGSTLEDTIHYWIAKKCGLVSTSFFPQPFSWVIRSCRLSKSLSQLSHRYTSTHLDIREMLDWNKRCWNKLGQGGVWCVVTGWSWKELPQSARRNENKMFICKKNFIPKLKLKWPGRVSIFSRGHKHQGSGTLTRAWRGWRQSRRSLVIVLATTWSGDTMQITSIDDAMFLHLILGPECDQELFVGPVQQGPCTIPVVHNLMTGSL